MKIIFNLLNVWSNGHELDSCSIRSWVRVLPYHDIKGEWYRENCEQKDVARFKILSDLWTFWPKYNADNTLIVDTEHFWHYFNLRICCLIVPEEMPDKYLVETLSCQLAAWFWTPYRARYADHVCREVPLTIKSLVVYRKFVDLANGDIVINDKFHYSILK